MIHKTYQQLEEDYSKKIFMLFEAQRAIEILSAAHIDTAYSETYLGRWLDVYTASRVIRDELITTRLLLKEELKRRRSLVGFMG